MEASARAQFERAVDDAMKGIIRTHIDPWLQFNAQGVRGRLADGAEFGFEGIEFVGHPRDVFWNESYIDRYLREVVDRFTSEVTAVARERGDDIGIVLYELYGALVSGIGRVLDRMVNVDRRIRGKGFPDSVQPMAIEARFIAMNSYVASRIRVEQQIELTHARTIMIHAASKASALLDTYSTWLLAGFAAFVAALLANQGKVSGLLSADAVPVSLVVLATMVLLGIAQKAIAVFVAAGSAGDNIGRDVAERGEAISGISVVASQILQATLPWVRPFVRKRLNATLGGDIAADGRMIYRSSQYQGAMALAQVLLLVVFIVWMAWASRTQVVRAEAKPMPTQEAPVVAPAASNAQLK